MIKEGMLSSPLLLVTDIKEVTIDIKEIERSEPLIYFGPQKKNSPTRDLEFIIKSYIDDPQKVSTHFEQKDCMVQVDKFSFNLSEILADHVNFEQIAFTVDQLNRCLQFFIFGKSLPKISNLNLSEYHPAERKSFELWEGKSNDQINQILNLAASKESIFRSFGKEDYDDEEFVPMFLSSFCFICLLCYDKKPNPFLKKEVNKVMFILLNICLIANALSRPYNEPEMALNLYRGERGSSEDHFILERKQAAADQKLIFTKKFTSTSTNKRYVKHFGNILTYCHQSPSLNPLGKDISLISWVIGIWKQKCLFHQE